MAPELDPNIEDLLDPDPGVTNCRKCAKKAKTSFLAKFIFQEKSHGSDRILIKFYMAFKIHIITTLPVYMYFAEMECV